MTRGELALLLMRRPLVAFTIVALVVVSGELECSPIELTASQEHGREIYGRMCAVCHGAGGEGYKADQAPALAHRDFLASVTDQFLRSAIANGRGGTTMSAWAKERGGPLEPDDVTATIAFLRTWDRREHPSLDERPSAGNASAGTAIFARECVRCHGVRGTGGPNVNIGNAQLLSTASDGFLRHAIRGGRSATAMASYQGTLGDGEIEDVLAALRSWKSPVLVVKAPTRPPPLPLGPVPLNPRGPEPVGFRATPLLTPADVIKSQLDRGARMALLDARAPSDYTNEHISGAVSVPFYDPEPYVDALPRNTWLVCYCGCPHAESGSLAQKLVAKGFTKVTVLDEGLGVWRSRKYGIHSGLDP